jgi:hypothetical protein
MQRFGNWICFLLKVKSWKISTLLGPLESANPNHWISVLSNGPNKVSVSYPILSENGNRAGFITMLDDGQSQNTQ